ncbi:Nuclear pore complex protein [Nesidiocoris tenuis]|uniref:Nuclear pore protein n=1 Tax=Nesidiocoris tenuis TaxID=355587 RepID=A0ABN7ABC7_9HEMI|nr:Nuclear pore complex protein [Nesidiocoris tenuis]
MAEVDFSDLVYEAEQLSTELEGTRELPKIERSLKQVLEATQALWSRVSATGAQEAQAKLLLGSKGFDLTQLGQKLDTLCSRRTFEPLDPVPLTDIQSFLKNESENAILQLIESTHQNTFNHVDNLHHTKVFEEWHGHKTNVMNSLLGYSKQIVDVPMRKESVVHETLFGARSMLDQEEMAYFRILMEYNNAILRGLPTWNSGPNSQSLLEKFAQVSLEFNNQKLSDMWKMLTFVCQLPPLSKSNVLEARAQPQIQDKIVFQALAYLEIRYREFMEITVSGNLKAARRGGVPGTIPLVKGFINVRMIGNEIGLEDAMVEGSPLWPMVFYCLRCGDISAAIQCLKLAGPFNEDLTAILEDLRDSPQRKVNLQAEMQLRSVYKRVVRSNSDPYKRAVYCLLGACDVNDDHRTICKTTDDYLWLKLWQVREEEAEPTPDRIYFSFLQNLVLEDYGEQYYKANEQPHVFFQLLVLTGQWESAIDFLVRVDKYRSHAVHMAIAIHELNLLALPSSINAPLIVIDEADKAPMRRLNLLRLVLLYTGKFEHSDPKEILHYFFTLRKLPGKNDDKNAFVSCLIDYLIETKQYDLILGTLEMDGCRSNAGLLDAFEGSTVNVQTITQAIAQAAESRGQLEETIKLYYLCGNHEKLLSIMNTLLSQVLSKSTNDTTSLRSRLVKFANQFHSRYQGENINCKMSTQATFRLLLKLVVFFDMYHLKEYNKALDIITSASIIPLSSDEMEDRIKNFKVLEESVLKNIPDILLAVMNIYYHQYQAIHEDIKNVSTTMLEDLSRTKQLSFIRERARLLTTFGGAAPYRMPGDTNTRLVQMEIRMT